MTVRSSGSPWTRVKSRTGVVSPLSTRTGDSSGSRTSRNRTARVGASVGTELRSSPGEEGTRVGYTVGIFVGDRLQGQPTSQGHTIPSTGSFQAEVSVQHCTVDPFAQNGARELRTTEQPSWATPSVREWKTVSACTPTSASTPSQRRGPARALTNHSGGYSQMLCGGQRTAASDRHAGGPGEAVVTGCALLRGCGGGRSRRRHSSRRCGRRPARADQCRHIPML